MSSKAYAPTGIQHINLTAPQGSLHLAEEFYTEVIGFTLDPVPSDMRDCLKWFRIGDGPQQIHMAYELETSFPKPWPHSSRHAAFSLPSQEALLELQKRIWAHKQKRGNAAALACDEPGEENSGAKVTFQDASWATQSRQGSTVIDKDDTEGGAEYPTRFFARDYAGNGLEFMAPR